LTILTGDMANLAPLADAGFDLIVNPCSTCFVPDLQPVWQEAFRVLRPGGVLMSGHMNPAFYLFDTEQAQAGRLDVRHTLPYADPTSLDEAALARHQAQQAPYEFSHTLETLIGGQLAAGFVLTDFFEDRFDRESRDTLSLYMPTLLATRALKPETPLHA
jgi:SAM-dependent methyltransferase